MSCEGCVFVEQSGIYEICTLGDKCKNQLGHECNEEEE